MREAVKKYIAEHYEDYVKDLEALTNIDSGNGGLMTSSTA